MTAHPKSTIPATLVFRDARRVIVLAMLGLIVGVGVAPCQSPEQRAELVQFNDSLSAILDTVQLLDLESQMMEVATTDRFPVRRH